MNPVYLYPHKLPNIGDIVITQISNIEDTQAYCQLLEYAGLEGMIPISELSQKKVHNIRKFLKIGKQDYMEVIAVDPIKGYVDLSKKHITQDDIDHCKNRYLSAKRTILFLHKWSERVSQELTQIALTHYRRDANDVYRDMYVNNAWLQTINATNDMLNQMWTDYQKLYAVKPQKFERKFEFVSFDPNGADLISRAIKKALELSTDSFPLTCVYTGTSGKSGSLYSIQTVTTREDAPQLLEAAVEQFKEVINGTNYLLANVN